MTTAAEEKNRSYFLLDKAGDVLENKESGNILLSGTVIFIDNNVCQHLAQVATTALNDDIKTKIENLIKICTEFNLSVFPYIGLTELSTNRISGKLDRSKYSSHLQRIKEYLVHRGVSIAPKISDFSNGMSKFKELHELFYVHLLKIKNLEFNGLKKENAIKNLVAYIEWAEQMKVQTIFPTQVAFALFGGEPKARKIAKFEKNKAPLQSIWGAAWDMLYLFISQQYAPLKIPDSRIIFATNDEALWITGSLFNLRGAISVSGKITRSFGEVNYDFPHFRDNHELIQEIHKKILRSQILRANNSQNPKSLSNERKTLEKNLESIS